MLAAEAGVSAATISEHLRKLLNGGLVLSANGAYIDAHLTQDAGDRGEGGALEWVGAVRGDDGVEHERFDVARVGLGV